MVYGAATKPGYGAAVDLRLLVARAQEGDRNALHSRYLNDQMVRMLRTIGYDVGFCRAEGAYLYDRDGERCNTAHSHSRS